MQQDIGKRIPGEQIVGAAEFGGRARKVREVAQPACRQQRHQRHDKSEIGRNGNRAEHSSGDDSGNGREIAPAEADEQDRKCGSGVKHSAERRLHARAKHKQGGGQSGECADRKRFQVQFFHFAVLLHQAVRGFP